MSRRETPQDTYASLVEAVRLGRVERRVRQTDPKKGTRMRHEPVKLGLDLAPVAVFHVGSIFGVADSIFEKTAEERDHFTSMVANNTLRLPYPTMCLLGGMIRADLRNTEAAVTMAEYIKDQAIYDQRGSLPEIKAEHDFDQCLYFQQAEDYGMVTAHLFFRSDRRDATWKIAPYSLTMLQGGGDPENLDEYIDIAPDPNCGLTPQEVDRMMRGITTLLMSGLWYCYRIVTGTGSITYADAGPLSAKIAERRERMHLLPISRVRLLHLDDREHERRQCQPPLGGPSFKMPTHYRRGTYVHAKGGRVHWRRSTIVNAHLGELPPPPPWYDVRELV